MKRINPLALVFSVLCFTAPLSAEDDLCNATLAMDDVVGNYNLTVGTGVMNVMGMTVPYPNTDVIEVTIAQIGDELVMTGTHSLSVTFSEVGIDEPDWNFDAVGVLSDNDLALALGCDSADHLPWTLRNGFGVGTFISEDGTPGKIWMRFVVYNVEKDVGVTAVGNMIAKASSEGVEVTFHLQVSLDAKH